MVNDLKTALREWIEEVEREAAKLIERGIPPIEAMERAGIIVRMNRQNRSRVQSLENADV